MKTGQKSCRSRDNLRYDENPSVVLRYVGNYPLHTTFGELQLAARTRMHAVPVLLVGFVHSCVSRSPYRGKRERQMMPPGEYFTEKNFEHENRLEYVIVLSRQTLTEFCS